MTGLFFLILLIGVVLPIQAHAGFFGFLNSLFGDTKKETLKEQALTSQNVSLLQAAQNHDPNPSKGGGDITIIEDSALLPESGPLGTIADIEETQSRSDQISIYVVREGDSLSQIAKMFGVSTNTIIWANDINRGDLISVGQELVILPISGVRHSVTSGDTLKSIAKKYDGHLEEILDFNGLSLDATLAVGDIVVIPDGEIATPVQSTSSYTATTRVRGTGGPTYDGYYLRPISGGTRTQGLHGYNGVDLATYSGAPIFAAASGDVIIARNSGWNGGYGTYLVIKHDNGTQTLYAHNSSNIVKVGWHVVKGQVIGYVGSTGKSTGPHIHFEVRGAKNPWGS